MCAWEIRDDASDANEPEDAVQHVADRTERVAGARHRLQPLLVERGLDDAAPRQVEVDGEEGLAAGGLDVAVRFVVAVLFASRPLGSLPSFVCAPFLHSRPFAPSCFCPPNERTSE